jgi:hypothetical protein
MPDIFQKLPPEDQREMLELVAADSGRPAYLLEKDIWVVWALSALFQSHIGEHLAFKGGTSLSKAYRAIDRFSEDLDLTYDVREIIPDLAGASPNGLPQSRSQENKWSKAIRQRLPGWIAETVCITLDTQATNDGLSIALNQENDKLAIGYHAHQEGHSYTPSNVLLDFGARATGDPTENIKITCDAASYLKHVSFPIANPRVMKLERTFWEKATAAHVYCLQGNLKGERFARHWSDIHSLSLTKQFDAAIKNRALGLEVAKHKACFFPEKAADGAVVDYEAAIQGSLRIVPTAAAREALKDDYQKMLDAGLLKADAISFDDLMDACQAIEDRFNEHA